MHRISPSIFGDVVKLATRIEFTSVYIGWRGEFPRCGSRVCLLIVDRRGREFRLQRWKRSTLSLRRAPTCAVRSINTRLRCSPTTCLPSRKGEKGRLKRLSIFSMNLFLCLFLIFEEKCLIFEIYFLISYDEWTVNNDNSKRLSM